MIHDTARTATLRKANCWTVLVCLLSGIGLSQGAAQIAGHASSAQDASAVPLAIHSADAHDVLHITVGRSIVLTSAAPLRRVYVGNPSVLQTFTSGSTEVVLTAKSAGVSSLVIWDEVGATASTRGVCGHRSGIPLRFSLTRAFPGSSIHAEAAEGKIFLSYPCQARPLPMQRFKMASLYA